MTVEKLSREEQALLALHDFGSREGASARRVFAQMKDDGFTEKEIADAILKYAGTP